MGKRTKISLRAAIGLGVIVLLLPLCLGYFDSSKAVKAVSDARQIYLSADQASLDGIQAGLPNVGFPAEQQAVSKTEYIRSLVQNNYLQLKDLKLPDALVLANVSKDDPSDTVFAVSQDYYDHYILKKKKAPFHRDFFMVLTKSGKGGNLDNPLLPPRKPAFLPP